MKPEAALDAAKTPAASDHHTFQQMESLVPRHILAAFADDLAAAVESLAQGGSRHQLLG